MSCLRDDAIVIPTGYGPLVASALKRKLVAIPCKPAGTGLEFARPRGLIERFNIAWFPESGEPRPHVLFGLQLTRYRIIPAPRQHGDPYIYIAFNAGLLSMLEARRELGLWQDRSSHGVKWWQAYDPLQRVSSWRRFGMLTIDFFVNPQTATVSIPFTTLH